MYEVKIKFDTYINQKAKEIFIGLSIKVPTKEDIVVEIGHEQAQGLLEQLIKSISTIEDISNPNKKVVH